MSDIFREIDEEIRQENYLKLVQDYGIYVLIVAAIIAAMAGGYAIWETLDARQRTADSDRYLAALELVSSGSLEEAASSFEALSVDAADGYRLLAWFRQAGTLAELGQKEKAVEIYDRIAAEGGATEDLRDLAQVKAALALVDLNSLDDVKARIGALAESDSAWRYSAREAIALAAFASGNVEEARSEFQRLMLDPFTPFNLRTRADEMLLILGPPAVTDSDGNAEAEMDEANVAPEDGASSETVE